jgi:hypothetical protein
VKRSGPIPKLIMAPTQSPGAITPPDVIPFPGTMASELTGKWRSAEGENVIFQGSQYAYYETGQFVDGGLFQIQNNQLVTKSQYTGEVLVYLFQVSGNELLLKDSFGQVYRFFRSQ